METFLNDKEILDLLSELKTMTVFPEDLIRSMKSKRGHSESEHIIQRPDGSTFHIRLRLSNENPMDFSVILGFCPAKATKLFLLRRYNGKSHEHKNKLESEVPFYDYHIHTATERYQKEGTKEECFAEVTDRYTTIQEALKCLIKDCNVILPQRQQTSLDL